MNKMEVWGWVMFSMGIMCLWFGVFSFYSGNVLSGVVKSSIGILNIIFGNNRINESKNVEK